MSKGNGMSSIHLPPQEQIRQLRGMLAQQQYTINVLTGRDKLLQEVANLSAMIARKMGGTAVITKEDSQIIEGAKVKVHFDKETESTTYTVELKKEEEEEQKEEEKPDLKIVN